MALYVYVCLWGDYFHEQRVKLRIANVGNSRQARVRTTFESTSYLQKRAQGKLLVETTTQQDFTTHRLTSFNSVTF